MTIPEEKRAGYISLKEASERFGYSQDYLGQLIRKGKLDGKLVYSHVAWVTTPAAVEGYILAHKDKKKKKYGNDEEMLISDQREVGVVASHDEFTHGDTVRDMPTEESPVVHDEHASPLAAKWLILLLRALIFVVLLSAVFVFYLLTTAFGEEIKIGSRVANASQTFSLSLHANDHE